MYEKNVQKLIIFLNFEIFLENGANQNFEPNNSPTEKYFGNKELLIPSNDQNLLHMLFRCISGGIGYFYSEDGSVILTQYVEEPK